MPLHLDLGKNISANANFMSFEGTMVRHASRPDESSFVFGDAEIRRLLTRKLRDKKRRQPDAFLIEELGICQGTVRVDLAFIDKHIHGYEIKSNRDNLKRLAIQIETYSKVLDFATLVVGERYFQESINLLPEWWGVILVDQSSSKGILKEIRKGLQNPCKNPRALAELIWRDHAVTLLEERNGAHGIKTKPREKIWDRICEYYSLEEIAENVRRHLRSRSECF